ncbi:MAG: tetratricopeptide repeat protein [bacterium]
MRKIALVIALFLAVGVAQAENLAGINREDLSLKAGPTEPGEALAYVWLETFVYPKEVQADRLISLGVRLTGKADRIEAAFDFGKDKVVLTSPDGTHWSGAYEISPSVAQGLHVARYTISRGEKSVQRTVDFFVAPAAAQTVEQDSPAYGEIYNDQGWQLTVVTTGSALDGDKSRLLKRGESLLGVTKTSGYKVVFNDGREGWVPSYLVSEPVDQYFALGFEAYRQGYFWEAVDYFKLSVKIDPAFVDGYLWLAKSHMQMEELDAASRAIREAIRLDDRNMEAKVFANTLAHEFYETGRSKFQAGRFNEAVAAFQKVVDLKPTSLASWIELGKAYEKLGLASEARSAWREALRVDPSDKSVYALLRMDGDQAAVASARFDLPASLSDDSLLIVKQIKTKKGTKIDQALKSVVTLTKSLGTPVIEKGWQVKKEGEKFLVRYLCEQGSGALEAFEWLVDIDSQRASASNDNARMLMNRW